MMLSRGLCSHGSLMVYALMVRSLMDDALMVLYGLCSNGSLMVYALMVRSLMDDAL